jgi:glycosyltransferase involved in cell wall biosynthesis
MKISALICVYYKDNPQYFFDAMQSIIFQTVQPSEIVLVIDGPVGQDIQEVVSRVSKTFKNFKIIQLEENVGHGKARQIGIDNCIYNYIALMDSDDICILERFEEQIKVFMADNDLSIVGGWINEFNIDISNSLGERKLPGNDQQIKQYLKYRCPMNQATVMFKKADVVKAGGYLDWHHEEDYYLWLRMHLQKSKFKNIQKVLVHVRADKDYYARRGGMEYFLSEAKLQMYMYKNSIINPLQLIMNIFLRFIVQIAAPNILRRFIFILLRRNT